jgi:aminotransferase
MPLIRSAWMPDNKSRAYRMCATCVMDTTDPDITFDEHGRCSYCTGFDRDIRPYWKPTPEGRRELDRMLEHVKAAGRGRRYDCIIGLSGGVDSSYLAVKIVEWGLRPLVVHVDAGWNSELAVKNIEQIVTRLGLDMVTHVVDWEDMKELQLAFLRSNLANQDIPQDHAFFAALYSYAVKSNIQYVINGTNFATESILPKAWGYDAMDARHLTAIHRRFGTRPLRKFPIVSFFKYYVYLPKIRRLRVVAPLDYISYNKQEAIDFLEKTFGWRYYGGKHYESRWTRFYQAHYLPRKFGYDKRKAHLSSLIVAGQMTRKVALQELERPLYTDNELVEDMAFVAKKLGITVDELRDLIAQPPRYYNEFPTNGTQVKLGLKALGLISYVLAIGRKLAPKSS